MTSRRTILWLLMLATAIMLFAGSASSAQASCGDYLLGHDSARSMPAASHAEADQTGPSSRPNHQVPCHGPGCQKAPTEPLSPVPARITVPDHDRLGCLTDKLPLPTSDRPLFEGDRPATRALGHPMCIEHPPRA